MLLLISKKTSVENFLVCYRSPVSRDSRSPNVMFYVIRATYTQLNQSQCLRTAAERQHTKPRVLKCTPALLCSRLTE